MKYLLAFLLAFLAPPLHAQQVPDPALPADRDQLMEDLLVAPDRAALDQALAGARRAGLPEQMLLEARFVFFVNQNNTAALATLAPALAKQLPDYSPDDTLIFAAREDFASIVHYTKALVALQNDQHDLFEKEIKEAFWLSPDHGPQFAPHIKKLRLGQAMADLTLDLGRSLQDQKKADEPRTLASLKGEAPAFLLHFWSPWVQPSLLAMPEFVTLSKTLLKHKIPVASILLNANADSHTDADAYLASEGRDHPGVWLVDSPQSSLSSLLRISSFPTVVLVDGKGHILFNGDPTDPELWSELSKIRPEIEQSTTAPVPSVSPHLPEPTRPEPEAKKKEKTPPSTDSQ